MSFKAGDVITCVDNSGSITQKLLIKGKEYTVVKCDVPYCSVLNEDGAMTWFYTDRFELKTPAVTEALPTKTEPSMTLPTDSTKRKDYPLLSGCIKYFPAALAGVSNISKLGNDKHNPGQPLHHARGKSMDHGDCVLRHLIDVEDLMAAFKRGDTSVTKEMILTEVNQLAWRALAYSQMVQEQFGAPLAPGADK